jgi:hypothetical protein
VDLAASKKTTVVDLPLTEPVTMEETDTEEEDVIVTTTDEEVTRAMTDTLVRVVRTEEDLLPTTAVTVTEDLLLVVVTETTTAVLRGMTATETTDVNRGDETRGVPMPAPLGKGVPSGGRGLLLVTTSRRTTRRRIEIKPKFPIEFVLALRQDSSPQLVTRLKMKKEVQKKMKKKKNVYYQDPKKCHPLVLLYPSPSRFSHIVRSCKNHYY